LIQQLQQWCHSIFAERNEDSELIRYLRKRTEAVKDKDY